MKKALSMILAAACMMSIAACSKDDGSSTDPVSDTAITSEEERIIKLTYFRKMEASDSVAVNYDFYADKDAAVYDYVSDKDKESCFDGLFTDSAFQNGEECDAVTYSVSENDDRRYPDRKKMTATVYYYLKDDSDITLKVTDKNGDVTYIEKTVSLAE